MRLPALSVSRSPVQETRVWSCTPPPLITRPLRVEEAVVVLIRVVLIPPANVEVAVEVEVREPNCPTPASTKEPWRPVCDAMPPTKVEVAVEVEGIEPVV